MAVQVKLEHTTDTKPPSLPSQSEPPKMKPAMGLNAPVKTMKTDYKEERGRNGGDCFGYDVRQNVIKNVETILKELVGIICCSI